MAMIAYCVFIFSLVFVIYVLAERDRHRQPRYLVQICFTKWTPWSEDKGMWSSRSKHCTLAQAIDKAKMLTDSRVYDTVDKKVVWPTGWK